MAPPYIEAMARVRNNPERAQAHPRLNPVDLPRHNLPRQLTSFIGRKQERAEIKKLLRTESLLTLTGTGGSGKTRLALQVAGELLHQYADGVWLVELAALTDPALVPHAVASAVGVPEQPDRPLIVTLTGALRSKSLLILLDNCEHLLAACGQLADTLLRWCVHVRILATSREGLAIGGEARYPVLPLPAPDPQRLPPAETVARYDAVQLFAERAKSVLPDFTVTEGNVAAVAQLCHRVDGIPLAIELAAARVKVLGVDQIVARLDDRFRFLTHGNRTALPRHQTLRAAMDWSYSLLSGQERALLRRLSVFIGGWTLQAAEVACSGEGVAVSDVLDLLAQLVDKSLVEVERQSGETRYRLLETIRQYALDRLLEAMPASRWAACVTAALPRSRGFTVLWPRVGEVAGVRGRHFDWCLELAEQAEPELFGPREEAWGARLEVEHDNLRAALAWGLTDPGGDASLRLAGALGRFWFLHGHVREGRRWLERALLHGGGSAVPARAKALGYAGTLARVQGDYERATTFGRESLDLFTGLGDRRGIALTLLQLGAVAQHRRDLADANRLFMESLERYREVEDPWGHATALTYLGEVARNQGDDDTAASYYEESLIIARKAGLQSAIAISLGQLGAVSLRQGNHRRGATLYREALILNRRLGVKGGIVATLSGLAGAAVAEGKPERAARLLGAAEGLRDAISVLLPTTDRSDYERYIISARRTLTEDTFASTWADGRTMTLEQAVDYALAPDAAQSQSRPQPAGRGLLTPREWEVAELIARGLSNREIAEALVITERTAESHVQHILDKLGVTSRGRIAAWTVERRPHKPAQV